MNNSINNPLLLAILENNLAQVEKLKKSHPEWINFADSFGFIPVEIAQFLGHRECEELVHKPPFLEFKVQDQNQSYPRTMNLAEFESRFNIIYRKYLTFSSYQFFVDVLEHCPYFFRLEKYIHSGDIWEKQSLSLIKNGKTAETYIKWINSHKGFGLFADDDLPEKAFVAEYTGLIRSVDEDNLGMNPYCFQYPKQFLSSECYVIDALLQGNISRFINHSTAPNLQPLWLLDRKLLHLIFFTNQNVPRGTELTFNYGFG